MSSNITTKSNSKSKQKSLHVKDKTTSSLIIKTDKVMIPVVKRPKKQPEQQQQQQQKQIIVKLPNKSTPTSPQQHKKRNILPVKARRVERRKEIKSMTTEAINDSSSSSDDNINTDLIKKKKKQHKRINTVNTTVYAGPTFNNAPNPNTLPLPTTLVSMDLIKKQQLQKHSQDLMNILSTQQTTSQFERDLSEIQRGLRSMLKI